MPEPRCKHEIHESMRGKPLEKWHIYIHDPETVMSRSVENYSEKAVKGDLIMSVFDQYGKRWNVLAVGIDGKLHLFTKIGWVNGRKAYNVDGVSTDDKGRIIVES